MKRITLKTGQEAFVDDEDFESLNSHSWYFSNGYAVRYIKDSTFSMHREVLKLKKKDGNMVDHKNRNKLDNRKSNLRLADYFINARNVERVRNSPGVYWEKDKKKWRSQIQVNGKKFNLGNFVDRKEALLAYTTKCRELGCTSQRSS